MSYRSKERLFFAFKLSVAYFEMILSWQAMDEGLHSILTFVKPSLSLMVLPMEHLLYQYFGTMPTVVNSEVAGPTRVHF